MEISSIIAVTEIRVWCAGCQCIDLNVQLRILMQIAYTSLKPDLLVEMIAKMDFHNSLSSGILSKP
jgi:hypothetical protein